MSRRNFSVRWVRRNWPVGAVPYIIREDDLPRNQKVLVFLPHSDDGRFIGATLSQMNRAEGDRRRNEMRIVVVCPGYHCIEAGLLSEAEKVQLRWDEALCWGQALGFGSEQMIYFGAERSYALRRRVVQDQRRMDDYIRQEQPSMVFVPHKSDVAQHTNASSRAMVLNSLTRWIGRAGDAEEQRKSVFVVEYPTLHVPILPPTDKTIIVAFNDPCFTEIKHAANRCHKSLETKHFDMMGRFVEAIDALSGADTVLEARRTGDRETCRISDVSLNPVKSRGEHFGVTRLRLEMQRTGPVIFEERIIFPLSDNTGLQWIGKKSPE